MAALPVAPEVETMSAGQELFECEIQAFRCEI